MTQREELTVSVKALEWEKTQQSGWTVLRAKGVGVTYECAAKVYNEGWMWGTREGDTNFDAEDEEAAKAAAQSDYEQRILSTLVATPKPEATEGGAHEKGIEAAHEFLWDRSRVVCSQDDIAAALSAYLEASGLVLCDAKPAGYSMIDDDTGKFLSWTPDIEGTRWFNNYRATTYPVYRGLTPSPVLSSEKDGSDAL